MKNYFGGKCAKLSGQKQELIIINNYQINATIKI